MILTHAQQYCSDTLTTAIEGGINYWAKGRKFKRIHESDAENGLNYLACELKPHADEGQAFADGDPRNNWKPVNLDTIETAIHLLMSDAGLKLCRKDIVEDIRIDWADPDSCRSDAETADVIIQIALFGEIVFG
jgi:hypothetical protein